MITALLPINKPFARFSFPAVSSVLAVGCHADSIHFLDTQTHNPHTHTCPNHYVRTQVLTWTASHGLDFSVEKGKKETSPKFETWNPTEDADASQPPVSTLINLSESYTRLKIKEVRAPQLEAAARAGMRTWGAGLCQFQHMNTKRFVMSVDNDTDFRSRCGRSERRFFLLKSPKKSSSPRLPYSWRRCNLVQILNLFLRGKTGSFVTGKPNILRLSRREVKNDVWKYLQNIISGQYAVCGPLLLDSYNIV